MIRNSVFWMGNLGLIFLAFVIPATGENYTVILRGKVLMQDGTPPKLKFGMERICSDGQGSAPGPLVDKNGDYVWRMDVDPMRARTCFIRATHVGYMSTTIDISALNGYLNTNINLPTIVVNSLVDDPYAILMSDASMPPRAQGELKAGMKALDIPDYAEAQRRFQLAVEKAPKYAIAWHALGVVSEKLDAQTDAKGAYKHAIESDPKHLPSYMTLTHLCIKTKDWECAADVADALIKADTKHKYLDIHLHRAVALYGLKKLDLALESVQEAIRLDPNHVRPRAEYVYGRILEAKGDIEGARKHMTQYLELDKLMPDGDMIKQHLQVLGEPGTPETEPELEYP
jgi:tetratricopeptide (TPR) repeat protein